ncbi:carboxymuconolactone decarboxylase family protein [Parabacteroides sp. PF5-9]|uniref:carboxymuconolactone decarboxylase family protein n=1 Tax=Parabacteroides sp. PF5-9 TaxID=1742404 RepID=UPI00247345C4|nr:carboxymuconolactone decarboxylase family protein [Parabacteroides sp. PF5-9]MDH6358897.1 4-carboxymuconolactone decarboxylase [Parabacteroides sp. PF5-9]
MNTKVVAAIFFFLSLSVLHAQNTNTLPKDRVVLSEDKHEELFGRRSIPETDPDFEFKDLMTKFIFGEVAFTGNLDDQTQELMTIVALATNQMLPQLRAHTGSALRIGVEPVQIKEAIYQCTPFIGYSRVLNALGVINEVFRDNNITLPLESQKTITDEARLTKGTEIQSSIYGTGMRDRLSGSSDSLGEAVSRFLTEWGFGDFYTRTGLDLQTRELVILIALSTLGGTEIQLESHARGNIRVGNNKDTMISALIQCLPHIGFPRVLNAIYIIQKIEE